MMGKVAQKLTFQSVFLQQVVESIGRKRKAIKHALAEFSLEKVREIRDGECYEVVEIRAKRRGQSPVNISLNVWDDRWTWIDVRQPKKQGWRFEWQCSGRIGNADPMSISSALIQTFKLPFDMDETSIASQLDGIWQKIVLQGVRNVKVL